MCGRSIRRCGSAGHVVEKAAVEFAVDDAGALAVKLVGHPAGAEDHYPQIVVVLGHGLADGPSQVEAPLARGRRVLNHVHRQGNDRERPGLGLTAGHRQRHGQAVIHVHLVDDGQVEFVEYQRLRQVPRQPRMALDHGHRTRTPTLVGGREFPRHTNSKRGNHLQRERRAVIVVHQYDHVRIDPGEPFLRRTVAGEKRFPVRFLGPAQVHGGADGRHMGRGESGNDARHYSCSDLLRLPSMDRPPPAIMARYSSWVSPDMAPAMYWNYRPSVAAELGGVVDVAAHVNHPQPVPLEHAAALLFGEREAVQVAGFVGQERLAVLRLHQRHAEHVQVIALVAPVPC